MKVIALSIMVIVEMNYRLHYVDVLILKTCVHCLLNNMELIKKSIKNWTENQNRQQRQY